MAVQEVALGKRLWVTLLLQGLDQVAPEVPLNPAFCKHRASGTAGWTEEQMSESLS